MLMLTDSASDGRRHPRREAMPAQPGTAACIGTELRDGLLQDVLAAGLLVRAARRDLGRSRDEAEALLAQVSETLDENLTQIRDLIDRLAAPMQLQ